MSAAPLAEWLAAAWACEAEVRSVEVEGAAVSYRAWEANPALPVLHFVHGFQAHARWWDHIAPHFTDRYRPVAIDLTGMGDSDRRPEYSRRQYAREILAVLDRESTGPATLVSHSFGSVSALYAGRLAPERIERIVVVDAHVFRAEDDGPAREMALRPYATYEEAVARYRLNPPGQWPVPEVFAYLARHSLRETAAGWEWKFDPAILRSVHGEKIRAELCGLELPVDFIRGEFSETAGPDAAEGFRANLPRLGEPVTIPLCHHHVMIEQPLALVTTLRGLLARRT